MVATCIYKGLTSRRMDRLYLSCLPFGYGGVFLLLYFGTDLPIGFVCGITLLIGDAPGAMLAAIIVGSLSPVIRSEEHSGSTVLNSADARSAVGPEDQQDRAPNRLIDGDGGLNGAHHG